MHKRCPLLVLLMIIALSVSAQSPAAYALFDGKGHEIRFEKMAKQLAEADIVFFGEHHDSPICHWLQMELAKRLFEEKKQNLSIAMEMFETDDQLKINEYFTNVISKASFERECRLWPNYKTDYKPLVEFAHEKGLKLIASNVPRRYAAFVALQGLDGLATLSADAKTLFPPLPISYPDSLPSYKSMLEMGNGNPSFPQAQAIKDATMAYFTLENWNPGELCLHINGTFHSDNHEGIVWYMRQRKPDLKILVISAVEQADLEKLEKDNRHKGDFILVLPESMSKTH